MTPYTAKYMNNGEVAYRLSVTNYETDMTMAVFGAIPYIGTIVSLTEFSADAINGRKEISSGLEKIVGATPMLGYIAQISKTVFNSPMPKGLLKVLGYTGIVV